jgi:homoserine O-acetyltransferase
LLAVTGISGGGEQSIQFAVSYPELMDGIFPIVGAALWGTQFRFRGPLMASIIETCTGWEGGNYTENPRQCANNAISVQAAHFYSREWWNEYLDTPEAFTKWRHTFGQDYLDVQDARDLFYQIAAWWRGGVGDTPGFDGDLAKVLGSIKARTLLIYSPQDEFMLPRHIDAQVRMIPSARALAIDSPAGHLICCNADPQATRAIGDAVRAFLRELDARRMTTR